MITEIATRETICTQETVAWQTGARVKEKAQAICRRSETEENRMAKLKGTRPMVQTEIQA